MLLCGSVDGSVRVWRNYTLRDSQDMATALQVCVRGQPVWNYGEGWPVGGEQRRIGGSSLR